MIVYNFGDPPAVTVDYVNPDGTGNTQYFTFGTPILLATPDPVATQFAFAYTPNNTPSYDIYRNATVNFTGSHQLTSQGFASVTSIQYTADGTKIMFVAQTQAGASNLYVMNSDGSNLQTVDSADDAYVCADSTTVCYTKEDGNLNGQIWTTTVTGSNMLQITSDNWDHFGPQFSRDQTHLAWSAAPNGTYDVYTSLANGTQLGQVTNITPDFALTPTFSNDGTKGRIRLRKSRGSRRTQR